MFDILTCIRDEHDVRLVALAAAICFLSSLAAVLLLRQARLGAKDERLRWRYLAGIGGGFGVWATHFVAMLGYTPGVVIGYDTLLTVISLALPIVTTCFGFSIALDHRSRAGLLIGSLATGAGFAAMHYTGMEAMTLPATLHWEPGHVVASVVLAIVPTPFAMYWALHGCRLTSILSATLSLTLAVVLLHFTSMAGLHLTPNRLDPYGLIIAPHIMASVITAISLSLLALLITALIIHRRTREAIHASERQFSFLVRGISDCAIYMLDTEAHVANWNAGAQRLKGYSAIEAIGMPLAAFYTPEDRESGLPERAIATALAEGKFTAEGWRMRRDGTRFWAHVTIEPFRNHDGVHIGFAKITRDMTRFKEHNDRLENTSRQLDTALAHMHQGLCLFDADERIVLRNRRFLEMYNLPADACPPGTSLDEAILEALTARLGDRPSAERLALSNDAIHRAVNTPDYPAEVFEYGALSVSIVSRRMDDGGWVTTFDDVTAQRQSEARIEHMALHDGLTGLPNRTRFELWLDEHLPEAERAGRKLALVMLDLDRFKEINDTWGHSWGDVVLVEFARRLGLDLQEDEIVARLGGDEFALAKEYSNQADLAEFLRRVTGALSQPIVHEEQELPIGGSVGVAVFPQDGGDREALLNNADLAMYRAKSQLIEQLCYYEPSMDESARERRQIANDLRHAVDRRELALLYQPQHNLRTGALSGYEALLRWHHPSRGMVSPMDFIPIAEETGLIIPIGEWVMRQACREACLWPTEERVAVNLSPVQLVQPGLVDVVTRILRETGLPAHRLELEITETAIISDKARALANLRQIKELGVAIAMDDFGTGYSSLDTLHAFPFDKIKIDKSFLIESDTNNQALAIIRAVLALGQSLNIPVLAEGVETGVQYELLIAEGCEEAQGYYLGRPAAPPSLVAANDIFRKAQADARTAVND
ncbi:EAL domain-containing protein [Novosphingobium sp. 9]|uniref:bifunctional diguanylate cyclase/phosphodiesterase n=1 Tax=Novosphingobium sp. 9 TaxID=2025349 RepID=UPI0021B59EEF|nr:EAL domain-containing protein [Novosphingobium sp. 9]